MKNENKVQNQTITAKEYCEKENITVATLAYRIGQGLEVLINPTSWVRRKCGVVKGSKKKK